MDCSLRSELFFRFGLGETDDKLPGLELPALLEQFDAFKPLQHAAFGSDRAASFKAGMLAHGAWTMLA